MRLSRSHPRLYRSGWSQRVPLNYLTWASNCSKSHKASKILMSNIQMVKFGVWISAGTETWPEFSWYHFLRSNLACRNSILRPGSTFWDHTSESISLSLKPSKYTWLVSTSDGKLNRLNIRLYDRLISIIGSKDPGSHFRTYDWSLWISDCMSFRLNASEWGFRSNMQRVKLCYRNNRW